MFPSQISDPYLGSFAVGLLQGLSYCGLICLPYLTPYIAATEGGFRKGIMVTLVFGLGRTAAYGFLGGLTGVFKGFLYDPSYQKYISIFFGIVIVIIGTNILLRKNSSTCIHAEEKQKYPKISKLTQNLDIRAFSMGFSRGLVPCAPLIVILLYSLAFYSLAECIILACLFGLGTTLSPLLLFGGATRWLINKAPSYRWWIVKISGAILLLMGFDVLLKSITISIP